MATYLQDGVGYFPDEQLFTPDYNIIMRVLQTKQTQYDSAFNKLKSIQNSILSADLLADDTKKKRDDILKNAETALKDLPTIDLSLPQNYTAAKNIFQPFYDDKDILADMLYTKESKSNLQSGMALQNDAKEENRNRYWSQGVQYIYDGMEDFKNATPEERRGMRARRYVAKPNVDDGILKMFQEGKIKMSVDNLSGQAKYTDENGKQLQLPLMNLYMSMAENDPEALEGFKVMGSVERSRYIRENTDRLGGRKQAAEDFDRKMVSDYKTNKQFEIDKINESLLVLNTKVDSWKKKADAGQLLAADAQQAAADIAQRDRLQNSLNTSQSQFNNAEERIMGNPTAHLGNIYLTKNAKDLATALSQFGSRKIDVNPIYEKFVFPKELELYKHQLAKDMEKVKADEQIRVKGAEADIKNEYGGGGFGDGTSSTTTGGGAGRKQLDIPFAEDIKSGAGIPYVDSAGQADAYKQQQKKTEAIVNELSFNKLRFLESVLSSNEFVDSKGKPIPYNKRNALLQNGTELDGLYKKALTKYNTWVDTKDSRMYGVLDLKEKVENLNNVWSASIQFRKQKLTEVSNMIAGEKVSEDGYVYKSILKDGLLPGENPTDKNDFLKRIQSSKEFNAKVTERYAQELAEYQKNTMLAPVNAIYGLRTLFSGGVPTKEKVRTEMLSDLEDNYSKYINDVKIRYNKFGYNYYAAQTGQEGGGAYGRMITYQGKNEVKGEKADVYTEDLFTKVISVNEGDDEAIKVSAHTTDADAEIENDEDIKSILTGRIKQDLFTAIRSGKGADLGGYSIGFSGVANSDPSFHKYTIKFDQDYINKLSETKTKVGAGISNDQAKALINGIDIFVKSDKDNSLMSRESTLGEVDILLGVNGVMKKEIVPGYGIDIEKLSTGGYKVTTNYKVVTKDNLSGNPTSQEQIIPEGRDITNIYYETLRGLRSLFDNTQKRVEEMQTMSKNDPKNKPVTYQELLEMSRSF